MGEKKTVANRYSIATRSYLLFVVVLPVCIAVLYLIFIGRYSFASATLIASGIGFVLAILFLTFSQITGSIDLADQAISTAKSDLKAESNESRVQPAWDLARGTLEKYWQRNLWQNQSIFVSSVIAIVAGFCIFLYGAIHPANISVAIVTVTAGTVTQFVGATFLVVYRSTMSQAIKFNDTLERINSVGMAWYVIESMDDKTPHSHDLKNRVRGALALQIVSGKSLLESDFTSELNYPKALDLVKSQELVKDYPDK